MAPASARAATHAARPKSEPARPRKTSSKKASSKNAGPWSEWSDWYVSDDRSFFWRARQSQDSKLDQKTVTMSHVLTPLSETWDYEFTPGYQESHESQDPLQLEDSVRDAPTTTTVINDELIRPLSPSPANPPPSSPNPGGPQDLVSPKSSWPTIITTSTGYPTDGLSASSSRTLAPLPEKLYDGYDDYNNPLDATGTTLVPFAVTTHPIPSRSKYDGTRGGSSRRRPVGPVMRLIQETRSRKGRAKTEATRSSTANFAAGIPQHEAGGQYGAGNDEDGAIVVTKNRATSALAKKLHAKVKSEKELKMDPKRRVKAWLKDVEVDPAPIPLDVQGLPLYR